MGGVRAIEEGRAVQAALALLAAIVALDAASSSLVLVSLLVVVPLVGGLAGRPRTVAALAALAFAAGVAMGAVDSVFGSERHLVSLLVIAAGGAFAVVAARRRGALVALRQAERNSFRRIALLDRSSRLIAAPMDFTARIEELSRLVIPDVADLCVIDLTTDDGRLDGVVASATDPAHAELVRRTRAHSPIDVASEHPVAVALRTGEPQLRPAMTAEQLARYATSPEHLETMRRLAYRSAIVVPLVARGRTLGVLSVLRLGDPVPFEAPDVSLMIDLASRAAIAVDNARLFQEHRRVEARLQTVLDNLAEAITIVDRDDRLVYVNAAAAELLGYGDAQQTLRTSAERMFADFELFDEAGKPLDAARLPGRLVLGGEQAPPITIRRRHRATGEERWLTVKASAVPDPESGEPALAVNVVEDVTAERRARETAAFLAEASKLLASSLDFEQILQRVARAAVPQIADWCAVDVVGADGAIEHVAIAHVEPDKAPAATELRERYPADPEAPAGVPHVVRSGRSELHTEIGEALLQGVARDERHLELLRALEVTSVLIVPMTVGERTIGAISFVTTGGRRRLGEADRELAEELGRRAGVAAENARIHRERSQIAMTLQRSLLPPRLPAVPGLALAARFRAAGEANQVGGDFYDLFPAGASWLAVIGDVTGKGPDAAAITSLARYTIRTAAMYEDDPAAIMRRLNEALLADGEHGQLCTAACLRVTPASEGEPLAVELVCAGHPSPYLLRAPGDIEEVCRPGPLLGAFSHASWQTARFELAPGEGLVLYTDGVTDTRGPDGRFGHRRLEAVLRRVAGGDADEVAGTIDASLMGFQDGPQRDDVAVLVLRAVAGPAVRETSVVAGSAAADA